MKTMKNKIKMLAYLLCLSTLTGCNSKDKIDVVGDGMYYVDHTLDDVIGNDGYVTNSHNFMEKFINEFGPYLSDSQFNSMIDNLNYKYNFDNWYHYYQMVGDVLKLDENKDGYCFFKTFSVLVANEMYKYDSETSIEKRSYLEKYLKDLNILVTKDDFYEAMFTGDVEKVISTIERETGSVGECYARDLVNQFTIAYTLDPLDPNYEEFVKKQEEILDDLMSKLIISKTEANVGYYNTVVGRAFNNGIYFGGKDDIDYRLGEEKYRLIIPTLDSTKSLTLPYYMLNSTASRDECMLVSAVEYLMADFNESNYGNILDLLSYLVDWEVLEECREIENGAHVFDVLYNEVKEYFKTEEEFAEFIVDVENRDTNVGKKYMDILKIRLTKGNHYENLALFQNFLGFYNSHVIYQYLTMEIEFEVLKMNEHEANATYGKPWIENYLFWDYDARKDIEEIQKYFDNQELGTYLLTNDVFRNRDFRTPNYTYINYELADILSTEIAPEHIIFNNQNIIYYDIPENFLDGSCVRTEFNIEKKLMLTEVFGIKETIEINGVMKDVLIVSFKEGDSVDNYPIVRFKANANDVIDKEKSMRLVYEK